MRVPHQASTKWWIVLAAVLATVLTWWQARHEPAARAPERPEPRDARSRRVAEDPGPSDSPIEFEVELVE